MPGLLPSSQILAGSEGCPRQIVKFMHGVYGFQCHLEFTKESISGLVAHAYDPALVGVYPWVQDRETLLATDTTAMNELLWTFLDHLVVDCNDRNENPDRIS